jgi:hypothetical protein
MIVFLVSGLWHGARSTFIVWGFLHGTFQIIGDMTKNARSEIALLFRVNPSTFGYKMFQTVITFAMVCFAWIFFRANNINDALYIIKNINFNDYWVLFDDSLYGLGLVRKEFDIAIISIGILLAIDLLGTKIDLFAKLRKQHIIFRWVVYFALIFWILIFGSYGKEYNASDFIYFQF